MSDLMILGTDTDAGKTTFALLCMAAFADSYEYWKPVETGGSDSETLRQLVPSAVVHPPAAHFQAAVAPPLAAQREGKNVPSARVLVDHRPAPTHGLRRLLIETFGSPFSPLTEQSLQIELIQLFWLPTILVSPSTLGAVGRTLQALQALREQGVRPAAVVLLGEPDPFAEQQIYLHGFCSLVVSCRPPESWDVEGVAVAAQAQRHTLESVLARGSEGLEAPKGSVLASPPTAYALGSLDRAEALLDQDRRQIWHPYTPLRGDDAPLLCVGAADEFLHLANGTRLIDGISSWWTILHGHRHVPLMSALEEAAQSYDHVLFAGVTHPPAVALAELLLNSVGMANGRVFFSDNGSTAVEVALKMAYQYWCHLGEPQRTCFVGFQNGYHGDTFGAMAVSRDPVFFGRFEPLLFRAEIVPLSAERLDEVLARRRNEVAAVIVEPLVQGAGGMRMHTEEELARIRRVAYEHGVLFIADEVMTGGGRTGTLWAYQAAHFFPDLICAAKTLTGGVLPLAATLVCPGIVDAFDTDDRSRTFFHGHSFTANPLACAVAVANWRLLLGSVNTAPFRMEAFWNEALARLRQHPRVREVRIRGTIAAVELDVAGGYLADVGRELRARCLERDVLLRPLGNVLYAMPPFCTSEESLQRIADAMIAAVG